MYNYPEGRNEELSFFGDRVALVSIKYDDGREEAVSNFTCQWTPTNMIFRWYSNDILDGETSILFEPSVDEVKVVIQDAYETVDGPNNEYTNDYSGVLTLWYTINGDTMQITNGFFVGTNLLDDTDVIEIRKLWFFVVPLDMSSLTFQAR